jgi:ketosteroid isomerase-like protein
MASNKPTIYGKSAIGNMKRKMFQTWTFESWDVEIDEIQLAGDLGYARGTYIVNLKSKAKSNSSILEGTFLTIFKKQADGSWKIYRDCMMPK